MNCGNVWKISILIEINVERYWNTTCRLSQGSVAPSNRWKWQNCCCIMACFFQIPYTKFWYASAKMYLTVCPHHFPSINLGADPRVCAFNPVWHRRMQHPKNRRLRHFLDRLALKVVGSILAVIVVHLTGPELLVGNATSGNSDSPCLG